MSTEPRQIRHYYHVYADGQWEDAATEHLEALATIDVPMHVTVGVVGSPANRATVDAAFYGVDVAQWVEADTGWEQVTLAALQSELTSSHNTAVLYAHTKGASDGSQINVEWRRSMTRHVVAGWRDCLQHLASVDAVGCHWLTSQKWPQHVTTPFFGGNFWWATPDYLRTLPPLAYTSRWHAEQWIGLANPTVHDLLPGWPSLNLFATNEKAVA